MKLISWNVNGLRAVLGKNALDDVFALKPDFLGIQEIKASPDKIPSSVNDFGYKVSSNSAKRAGYSGVMSFCNFECSADKALFFDDDEGRVLEHRWNDIVLFNIYFPNGQGGAERLAYKMDFYDKFLVYLKELLKQGKKIIICGDVNTAHREIDLTHPKANEKESGFLPEERAWIDSLLEAGFIDTFRFIHGDEPEKYSWWSYKTKARERNVGWRIDYFFISNNLKDNLKDAFILSDIYGSDHCPVGIELSL